MQDYNNKEALHKKINIDSVFTFDSAEQYFFTLGQFLIYAFTQLGGVHKFNKEFNYLTNPYLPQDVQQLAIRIVRFLSKLPADIVCNSKATSNILNSLIQCKDQFCNNPMNLSTCTEAFFEGLHSENIFLGAR